MVSGRQWRATPRRRWSSSSAAAGSRSAPLLHTSAASPCTGMQFMRQLSLAWQHDIPPEEHETCTPRNTRQRACATQIFGAPSASKDQRGPCLEDMIFCHRAGSPEAALRCRAGAHCGRHDPGRTGADAAGRQQQQPGEARGIFRCMPTQRIAPSFLDATRFRRHRMRSLGTNAPSLLGAGVLAETGERVCIDSWDCMSRAMFCLGTGGVD